MDNLEKSGCKMDRAGSTKDLRTGNHGRVDEDP